MDLFLSLLLIAAGFVLIIKGGDWFVDAAVWVARITHMPEVLIGATIVSLGTTLPEITVSTIAAVNGDYGLAVTNSVGSMFCNVGLILGIGLLFSHLEVDRGQLWSKALLAVLTTLAILLFSLDGRVYLWETLLLLLIFVVYLTANIIEAVRKMKSGKAELKAPEPDDQGKGDEKPWFMILKFLLGAAGIALGAKLLVDNVTRLATQYLGISTSILGVTVVALGTSLPELVTCINSIRKNAVGMSLGNIIGANILNGTLITGICGLTAYFREGSMDAVSSDSLYQLSHQMLNTPILGAALALFVLLVLVVPLLIRKKSARWQGAVLLLTYLAYTVFLVLAVSGVIRFG